MNAIQIHELRELVEPLPKIAWQVKHIALATGFSESQVRSIVKSDPSFPKARMIGKTKTWKPKEVATWYERQEVA